MTMMMRIPVNKDTHDKAMMMRLIVILMMKIPVKDTHDKATMMRMIVILTQMTMMKIPVKDTQPGHSLTHQLVHCHCHLLNLFLLIIIIIIMIMKKMVCFPI